MVGVGGLPDHPECLQPLAQLGAQHQGAIPWLLLRVGRASRGSRHPSAGGAPDHGSLPLLPIWPCVQIRSRRRRRPPNQGGGSQKDASQQLKFGAPKRAVYPGGPHVQMMPSGPTSYVCLSTWSGATNKQPMGHGRPMFRW